MDPTSNSTSQPMAQESPAVSFISPPQGTGVDDSSLTLFPQPAAAPSIGPQPLSMTDASDPIPITTAASSSKVSIALLLVSGRRRTLEFEPTVSIGELKEVVWSTWPSDWADELPPSASFLRILYLGRILTDDTTLSSLNLAAPPESTVVHVSVRSFAPASGDEDLKKKQKKRGSRRTRASGTDASNPAGATGTGGETAADASRGCCGCIIC